MKKSVLSGMFLGALLISLQSNAVSADTLLGTYNTSSTPAITGSNITHSFVSGNLLYISTNEGGVSVIDTHGTALQTDDTLLGSYTTTSTPAIGSNKVAYIVLSGNLLYITHVQTFSSGGGGGVGGVTVIDTHGTPALTDDNVVAFYSIGTSPDLIGGNAPSNTMISGNLLYISTPYGLSVIDTLGTPSQSDDVLVTVFDQTTIPEMTNSGPSFSFFSGNILYIGLVSGVGPDVGGLLVVDTLGTPSQTDDVVLAYYHETSSPAVSININHAFVSGNFIYVSNDGLGLTVIDTQGTPSQADDTEAAVYNTTTEPFIGSDTVKHAYLVGNLLYVDTYGGGTDVIDTMGTVSKTDDVFVTSYSTVTTPALQANYVTSSFIDSNVLFVNTISGLTSVYLGSTPPPALTPPASDTITTTLPINATISITSPADVTMGAITGTGQSALATNQAEWITKTNNAAGYELSIQASSADMTNANLDTVAGYTPAVPETPEPWNIATTDSEWGMHYSWPQSTLGNDTVWGLDDTYADNWINVPTTPFVIETSTAPTDNIGDSAVILFGAEVGSDKIQPTGNYSVDVIMTATTL